jgi:molecular chaperone DnaK
MRAAKLAGFKQVQLLQEPVAAAVAYGLGNKSTDGFWLVFDFGGGTFDAALVKAEDGILSVKDTEGNNWLGGKNLDYEIIDKIVIPYLQDNYSITSILNDANRKQLLREYLKHYSETARIQLSFKTEWAYSIELGILTDDNNEEIEVDIIITRSNLEQIVSPFFQKAIDITRDLLRRNNLKENDLDKLILVGGPTHTPILRQMLREQITENINTSIDPMTVVARGAALYASTIDVTNEIQDQTRDETKLQLEVKYEATSIETTESINVKVLKDKSKGDIHTELFVEFTRNDGAWNSNKTKISEKVALVEVALVERHSNTFTINIYDGQGNRIDCEPDNINILQGIGGLDGMQVMPYHICIVKHFTDEEKDLIMPIKGLEKNNRYPAIGVAHGLKTRSAIRPGMVSDKIKVPIYQGDYNSKKSNPELNNLVFEVNITGENLPALLPKGSDVDITIKVDKSGLMKFSAYFPILDYTEELEITIKEKEIPEVNELVKKISNAKYAARNANDIYNRLEMLENQLENETKSADGRLKILDNLRNECQLLDILKKQQEWPTIENKLKDVYFELENLIRKVKINGQTENLSISQIDNILADLKSKVDVAINGKKRGEAKELTEEIVTLLIEIKNELTSGQVDVGRLRYHNENFNSLRWKDKIKARALINQGLKMIAEGRAQELRPILHQIWDLRIDNDNTTDTLK